MSVHHDFPAKKKKSVHHDILISFCHIVLLRSRTASVTSALGNNNGLPSFSHRYAVVTGSNKGIGFEICRQLASKGVTVVLTSRDEKRGLEAVRKLREDSSPALPGEVVFHQLDVTDSKSAASLAGFIKDRFGKLDILVNNAGVNGFIRDPVAYAKAVEEAGGNLMTDLELFKSLVKQTPESAKTCLETNYYGVKRVTEALLPMLQLSTSPRIVTVSSIAGLLQNIPEKSIQDTLADIENLKKDHIDDILKNFLEDFQLGRLEAKGWEVGVSAYTVSKVATNAYARLLAKELPKFLVNNACPGSVKTDMTYDNGFATTAEGAEHPVRLAFLPEGGPSGLFFSKKQVCSFEKETSP